MNIEFANFEDMLKAVQGLPAMPIAVIDADEQYVLEGACEAAEAGYVDPILIGDENGIRNMLKTSPAKTISHHPCPDRGSNGGERRRTD